MFRTSALCELIRHCIPCPGVVAAGAGVGELAARIGRREPAWTSLVAPKARANDAKGGESDRRGGMDIAERCWRGREP